MVNVRARGEKNGRKKQSESLKQRPMGLAMGSVKALSANGTDKKRYARKGRGKCFGNIKYQHSSWPKKEHEDLVF